MNDHEEIAERLQQANEAAHSNMDAHHSGHVEPAAARLAAMLPGHLARAEDRLCRMLDRICEQYGPDPRERF